MSVDVPVSALDRSKLLTSPGVFANFVTFRCRSNVNMNTAELVTDANMILWDLLRKYEDRVSVDWYLTRGLSVESDFMARIHGYEANHTQDFLSDFQKTPLGRNSEIIRCFVGLTKPLNYITQEKAAFLHQSLFASGYTGEPVKYAIVIPIKKSAEWWNLSDADRQALMEDHTVATLPYLTNTKRKLYHSRGLSDVDFITYFETNDLNTFHGLLVAVAGIRENTYHVQYGNPTILGTLKSSEEVINALF